MKIGVFDSGYGGLTVLREIRKQLPQYDYVYLGDNARAPYGSRSFDIVYDFTLQAVRELFDQDCCLVILACNTASAKALRTIQQNDLPSLAPDRRVLGVIRPTVETVTAITRTGHIGILGTEGTVASHSYALELGKISPDITVTELACPMWVPIVECNEIDSEGADYFVGKYLRTLMETDPEIDTVVLGCTHYPLLLSLIRKHLPANVTVLPQGDVVARSLDDYLRKHTEMESRISRGGSVRFLTTESATRFDRLASVFMAAPVESERISIKKLWS